MNSSKKFGIIFLTMTLVCLLNVNLRMVSGYLTDLNNYELGYQFELDMGLNDADNPEYNKDLDANIQMWFNQTESDESVMSVALYHYDFEYWNTQIPEEMIDYSVALGVDEMIWGESTKVYWNGYTHYFNETLNETKALQQTEFTGNTLLDFYFWRMTTNLYVTNFSLIDLPNAEKAMNFTFKYYDESKNQLAFDRYVIISQNSSYVSFYFGIENNTNLFDWIENNNEENLEEYVKKYFYDIAINFTFTISDETFRLYNNIIHPTPQSSNSKEFNEDKTIIQPFSSSISRPRASSDEIDSLPSAEKIDDFAIEYQKNFQLFADNESDSIPSYPITILSSLFLATISILYLKLKKKVRNV
ncbi:MAG: hypothetical protein GF364_08955 [Candidatus Lokiarchaeota archaeon]|nr:hypothetical protein [Candidatus Lokiarchaeota archaeon]